MSLTLAALCLTRWLSGVAYGAYLRERHTANRTLRDLLRGGWNEERF